MKENKYASIIGLKTEDRIRKLLAEPIKPKKKRKSKQNILQDSSKNDTPKPKKKKKKLKLPKPKEDKSALLNNEEPPEGNDSKTKKAKKRKMSSAKEEIEKKPKKRKRRRIDIELAGESEDVEPKKFRKNSDIQVAAENSAHLENSDPDSEEEKMKSLKEPEPEEPEENSKSARSLQAKLFEKLAGSRFRYINEQLYSISGEEAMKLFEKDPKAFEIYHSGYRNQCSKWPQDPLHFIATDIRKMKKSSIIADMGCGDASLALRVTQKVHSFDLVAVNDRVTPCNIEKVPLKNKSVDVCVFCLSLMGTNLSDYIIEANRILKKSGTLKIAEIASRFTSLSAFTKAVEKMGFTLEKKKKPNDYFILFDFVKKASCDMPVPIELRPCVYKKR